MTTIHHPSCPVRAIENPAYCGHYPHLDHLECPSRGECTAVTLDDLTALCVCPEPVCVEARSADVMAMDITAHANQAWNDFQDNVHGRGTPKGLLSCVLLDADLPGPKAASWGVQA